MSLALRSIEIDRSRGILGLSQTRNKISVITDISVLGFY